MEQMEMQKISFTAKSTAKSPSKAEISIRDFIIDVDEPKELGGTDSAPNPVEYILAGMAGCIHILGFKVANELNMELNDLNIEVDGLLNPEKLFGMSTEERAGYQEINLRLIPETSADEMLLEQWMQLMMDRSPVLDNLLHSTPVRMSLR